MQTLTDRQKHIFVCVFRWYTLEFTKTNQLFSYIKTSISIPVFFFPSIKKKKKTKTEIAEKFFFII